MNLRLFFVCELTYVVAVRVLLLRFRGTDTELELWWTALRIASIGGLAWLLSRDIERTPKTARAIPSRAYFALGILPVPALVGHMSLEGNFRYLFAATSIVVGLREELAYRGILQTLISRRMGLVPALILSNLGFIAYHFGVQPFTPSWLLQSFVVGSILGYVFHLTGSLLFVSFLHAAHDAVYSFTPILSPPWPGYAGGMICLLILGALVIPLKAPARATESN